MKLYIVTRWGNPFEKEGPDGKDTNFLIRSASLENATKIADQALKTMATEVNGNRPVKHFAQFTTEIGEDKYSQNEGVVHGPWIESVVTHDTEDYPVWHRNEEGGSWNRS